MSTMEEKNPLIAFWENGGESPTIDPTDCDFYGMACPRELNPEDDYEKFFQYPEFNKAIQEHMDLYDTKTRRALHNLSEADQNSVLTTLTSKLYDNIVTKAAEVDYGDIPDTKGDITKLPQYDKLVECLDLLKNIIKEYRQDPGPIEEILTALDNIASRKTMFERAYRYDIELIQVMYCNEVLSIISGVSYMIATCIEFIKTPKEDTFTTVLDSMAYKKAKDHLIYTNLRKFNQSCAKGDFDKACDYLISQRTKNFAGLTIGASVAGGIAAVALILNIVPIMREIIFFFYWARTRVSDFLDLQADLIQMNAATVNGSDKENSAEISTKQMAVSQMFRNTANKIAVNCKQSEVKAAKDIASSNSKMKIDDLGSETQVSSLF